jgi:hypothetical protein
MILAKRQTTHVRLDEMRTYKGFEKIGRQRCIEVVRYAQHIGERDEPYARLDIQKTEQAPQPIYQL